MESNIRKFTYLSFLISGALIALVLWYAAGAVADALRVSSTFVFGSGASAFTLTLVQVKAGVAGVGGLVGFIALSVNARALEFSDDCFSEMMKVTWPTQKETAASTLVVSVLVILAALMFRVMDIIWGGVFGFIFS